MYQKNLALSDLINLENWQNIQDAFSESFGIHIRTIDSDCNSISRPSSKTHLYDKIIRNPNNSFKECKRCILKTGKLRRIFAKKYVVCKCPFGMNSYILPIKIPGGKVVIYMVIGPVILNKRASIIEYAEYAKAYGINPEELMDSLIEINVFSYTKIRSILNLFHLTFSHIVHTGYHKKRLGEITPEVIEVDPLFSRYYEEKVLDALLNTCTMALNADSGSVMVVDKNTKHLHIKVASKLDDNIIKASDIRMGEGIAGVAAATAEPIILPDHKDKNGLSKKMKREYIKSSMIVPFNKSNDPDVYGVLNLNISRSDREYSEKDIAFVKELTNLASIALLPIK